MALQLGRSLQLLPSHQFALIAYCLSSFLLVLCSVYALERLLGLAACYRYTTRRVNDADFSIVSYRGFRVSHVFGVTGVTAEWEGYFSFISFFLIHLMSSYLVSHYVLVRVIKRRKQLLDNVVTVYGIYMLLSLMVQRTLWPSKWYTLTVLLAMTCTYLVTGSLVVSEELADIPLSQS